MTFTRRLRRFAALVAAFGIALQALWPVIAQARPANSISVPLCSVDGARHEIELPLGNGQGDKGAEHCKLCVLGTDKDLAAPATISFDLPLGEEEPIVVTARQSIPGSILSSAHPRAPPIAS
jgi:hypothetical protein